MSTGNDETRLYGLMEVAEQQQAVVQAAVKSFAAERAAWERERERLAREVRDLRYATREAVRSAVQENLAGAATEGVAAVRTATGPLLGRLAAVTESAGQAEAALRGVVRWASGRLLGWIVASLITLMLLGWLASSAVLWWDAEKIAAAQARKAQLTAEIAELRANRDTWVKAGMLQRLANCTPGNRPCIQVDESAGTFGDQRDYRVIQGY